MAHYTWHKPLTHYYKKHNRNLQDDLLITVTTDTRALFYDPHYIILAKLDKHNSHQLTNYEISLPLEQATTLYIHLLIGNPIHAIKQNIDSLHALHHNGITTITYIRGQKEKKLRLHTIPIYPLLKKYLN